MLAVQVIPWSEADYTSPGIVVSVETVIPEPAKLDAAPPTPQHIDDLIMQLQRCLPHMCAADRVRISAALRTNVGDDGDDEPSEPRKLWDGPFIDCGAAGDDTQSDTSSRVPSSVASSALCHPVLGPLIRLNAAEPGVLHAAEFPEPDAMRLHFDETYDRTWAAPAGDACSACDDDNGSDVSYIPEGSPSDRASAAGDSCADRDEAAPEVEPGEVKPEHDRLVVSQARTGGGGTRKAAFKALGAGNRVICTACQLDGRPAGDVGCLAVRMLQRPKIAKAVAARREAEELWGIDPETRGESRFDMYRGVINWRFAGAQCGAGKRFRLANCLVYEVRSTFPNPVCGKGCDFMVKCEQLGHYVGFRTAEESKAEREGRLIGDDLRD